MKTAQKQARIHLRHELEGLANLQVENITLKPKPVHVTVQDLCDQVQY